MSRLVHQFDEKSEIKELIDDCPEAEELLSDDIQMNVPEDEDQSSDVEAALIQATEELGTKGKVFIVKDCSHVTWYIVAENGKGALDKVKSLLKGD